MNPDALKKRRNVPEEPEPEGEVKGTQDSLVFVVQKHPHTITRSGLLSRAEEATAHAATYVRKLLELR
jgi:hypothetical protein